MMTTHTHANTTLPWMEKYRPKTLRTLLHQTHVVKLLTYYRDSPTLPHMLFYGSSGTGKTSAIHAFAYQLFGPRYTHERVLELNASHERNLEVIQQKVKAFARIAAKHEPYNEFPCPAYKILVLDEADAITAEAQRALRRLIETTSAQTRFCFICNYASKIIAPIQSRCAMLRFAPIPAKLMVQRLRSICRLERMQCEDAFLKDLIAYAKGDMRMALNTLQLLQPQMDTENELGDTQTQQHRRALEALTGAPPDTFVTSMVHALQQPVTRLLAVAQSWAQRCYNVGYRLDLLFSKLCQSLLTMYESKTTAQWQHEVCTLLSTAQHDSQQPKISIVLLLQYTFIQLYMKIQSLTER